MTDEPVWDPDEIDPWLPARLAADASVAAAESAVYQSYWAALSSWLISVHRAVIRTGLPPDPTAVFAKAPQWAAAVGRVVDGPIRDTFGLAYARLFGDGYRYDSRPAFSAHLADVTNRMTRTPDEVFDLVASQIGKGSALGESIPELADRVDGVLSTTATERWPNRATVVARTETIGALNAGRHDAFVAFADDAAADVVGAGEPMEQMWLATGGSRTRPTHRRADGQRVPVGEVFMVGGAPLRFPGDPRGPAKEVIQCRCTMLLLEPGESVDMSNREFRQQEV